MAGKLSPSPKLTQALGKGYTNAHHAGRRVCARGDAGIHISRVDVCAMTRKDYELLAKVLRDHKARWKYDPDAVYVLNTFTNRLAYALQDDNPRFDVDKFREAAR